MVIFHSYVSLPEGSRLQRDGNLLFFWTTVDFFGTIKCCCQFTVYGQILMIYRYMMVKYGLSMVLANWERYDGNNLWYLIMIYIWGTMNAPPGGHGFLMLTWLLPRTHKFQFHKFGNGREALRWYTGCRCSSHHRFLYKSPERRGTGLVFGWVQRWRLKHMDQRRATQMENVQIGLI